MKRIIYNFLSALLLFICVANSISGQTIEYGFGEKSDVIDSVKRVLEWYKENYHQNDHKKLNLYSCIDNCDGGINLYISQYSNEDADKKRLVKKTSRFIKVSRDVLLPVIFQTDILSKELSGKIVFMYMRGYYIRIEKNEQYIWRVTRMNMVF